MTSFNKTCQIDTLDASMRLAVLDKTGYLPPIGLDFLPCCHKAKHSIIFELNRINNEGYMKVRVCDKHFKFLEQFQIGYRLRSNLVCKFRRNRL